MFSIARQNGKSHIALKKLKNNPEIKLISSNADVISVLGIPYQKDYIRIAGMEENSVVDGEGVRFTIFTQGCVRNCPGCHNPQTHDTSKGVQIPLIELEKSILANKPIIRGITLSGGEPFLQPIPCLKLAEFAHENDLDVWIYTGYTIEEILHSGDIERMNLLYAADVLVDGAYIEEKRDLTLQFRGSSNQRVIDVKESLGNPTIILKLP